MIYVKDNYTLENEQTVILLEAYPETLFTNTSDEEAVLEYSHNGTNWDTLLTLAPNQKQSIAVTSRYVRQITKTTVEAKGVGSHITPLVLAGNPLQSGTDFSDYITKPQLDSAIAKVNDKTALLATQEQLQTITQTQTRALTTETQQRHSQIDTINQTITRNKQAQDELINQKANQTALTALEAKVTANTTKNQSQDTEIAKKANQASLTAETTARNHAIETLKGTITTNKQTQDSTINQLRTDLNTKANQSDLATETSNRTSAITGLNQTVATHKQQLDRQIQSLEQSKADKNTVNQQLSTKANQSQIDGINTAMEQKASKLNQVTAGNGLTGGGTLANSFQIALGLPSTISRSTTNSVTTDSHTHAIDTATTGRAGIVQLTDNLTSTSTEQALTARQGKSLKEQLDRLSNTVAINNTGMSVMVNTKVDNNTSITAGEGLTGGGTLSENLVIALGTPSTITQSSTNTTTANSHSHAIDTATTTQAGIVTLSHETNGTNKTKAVSEFALGEVRRLVNNLNSTITSQTPNLTTLAWSSITGKPSTYPSDAHSHSINQITGLQAQLDTKAPNTHTHSFSDITNKPTTLAGYGITDAISRGTDTEITSLLTINKSDSYIQGKTSNTRKWYIGKGSSFSDDIQLHNFTHSTQLNLTNNKIVASHDLYVNDSKVITASDTTVFVTPDALNQALIAKAPINHQHTIAEVFELQSILNSKLNSNASAISAQKLTTPRHINGIAFDGTQDITLPIPTTSPANVSWSAISNKPANFTPSAHNHVIADITNLQRELDSKANSNHSHAWNSITDKPTTLTGYGIGNAMQTDTDSETTGLISINRADSYIQGKQGNVRRWYVGSGSSSNHNVQLSNSTHNTQLELTNDRITSNKALYVGTRRVLLEGDETASTTAQPTNTAVRVTIHPVAVLTDNISFLDSTTFVYPNGRIVHSFIYKNLRQPVFNSITSGGTHVRTLTINLPTAMPRHVVQVNAYFYRPEFTDASFPLIISHKANDISNSSINLQISGTAREISFSGYLDLVIIVEGF
ncbi:tail fiber protein [Moraxella catarrhalis]|uniref:tail fiber protein n=1 Tax=Moraxella catarrhalis TaxID=480 RepID=UPI00128DCC04|nr:tail fiber protein [Moraxella catarrhalis]MPY08819.1 hypothetical protein [Moraxella catarrhalis]